MPRKQGTSKRDASLASALLRNPKTPADVKSVAASDLAQRKGQTSKPQRTPKARTTGAAGRTRSR